jgi:hypothetical protein
MVLLAAAGFVLFLVGAWVGLVSGGGEPRAERVSVEEYVAEDFRFSYPVGWERVGGVEFPLAEAQGVDQVGRHTVGLDRDNWVTVFSEELPVDIQITPGNVDALSVVQREMVDEQLEGTDGVLLEGPQRVDVGDLPGFRARVAGPNVRGVEIQSTTTQLFRGNVTWVIACQSDAGHVVEIAGGCAEVLESFEPRPEGELVG